MPQFLVPLARKTAVGASPEEALKKVHHRPASGGQEVFLEEYTNIHRIAMLAREHPLVLSVEVRDIQKALDKVVKNAIGRAKKGHQSPWNLCLHVYHCVHIMVGCTVHEAAGHLLSLWWRPERKQKLTEEQESLARTVFPLDVVEGFHLLPPCTLTSSALLARWRARPAAQVRPRGRRLRSLPPLLLAQLAAVLTGCFWLAAHPRP